MNLLITSLVFLGIASCSQLNERKVVDNYYLIENENTHARMLSYKLEDNNSYIGISDPGVLAYAVDGNYILLQSRIYMA